MEFPWPITTIADIVLSAMVFICFFSLSVVMKRYASYIVVVNGTTTKVQLNLPWELVTKVAEIHAP